MARERGVASYGWLDGWWFMEAHGGWGVLRGGATSSLHTLILLFFYRDYDTPLKYLGTGG